MQKGRIMKKYIIIITMLFIVIGCNANKQIQLTHSDKEVELFLVIMERE